MYNERMYMFIVQSVFDPYYRQTYIACDKETIPFDPWYYITQSHVGRIIIQANGPYVIRLK